MEEEERCGGGCGGRGGGEVEEQLRGEGAGGGEVNIHIQYNN